MRPRTICPTPKACSRSARKSCSFRRRRLLAGPAADLVAQFDVAAPEPMPGAASEAKSSGSHTMLFDFGATDDLGLSEPSLARVAAQKAAEAALPDSALERPAAVGPAAHAGLIVERSGKVERVAPFRGAELVVGRGPTCDLVLATAGVSRRHARFVREGDSFRVLDLGSANGLRVNGERATERMLNVGDVVAIDDFTLTFVIDNEPLEAVVQSAPASAAAPNAPHVTVLHDAPLASMLEQDVLTATEEDSAPLDAEKELEIVAEASAVAPLVVGAVAHRRLGRRGRGRRGAAAGAATGRAREARQRRPSAPRRAEDAAPLVV